MKKFLIALAILLAFIGEVHAVTLANITIDGSFEDWAGVLSDSDNYVNDGISGIDDQDNPQSKRDITKFAYTWNSTHLFFYFKRYLSPGDVYFHVYLDGDRDLLMETNEKVVRAYFAGQGNFDEGGVGNYSPSDASGDTLCGDGCTLPGTLSSENTTAGVTGASNGLEFEVAVPWSALGLSPGTPMKFKASSSINGNLPPNQDNTNITDSLYVGVSIYPNNVGGGVKGSTVSYLHTVENLGNAYDTIEISTSGTRSDWSVELFYADGTPLSDTDGDGSVDVGSVAPGESVDIIVNITIPSSANEGDEDVTTVTATSSLDESVSSSATDTTRVGSIVIIPDNSAKAVPGTVNYYNHTITNNQAKDDTIEVNATSSKGWSVELFYADGTPLSDTDGDGSVDVGSVAPGESVDIMVKFYVPAGANPGEQDVITVTITSSLPPYPQSSANDTTTVAERVTIVPDNEGRGGPGTTISYTHTVTNSWNESDVIEISASSSQGWEVSFYHSDGVTPLSDTDGDGSVDTGELAPNGGSVEIIVRISIPSGVSEGTNDTTTVIATSSLDENYFDSATDITIVQTLVTYSDASRTTYSDLFAIGDTVYARASGLTPNRDVRFDWLDSSDTLVRSATYRVPANGIVDDEYTIAESDLPGNWWIILSEVSGGRTNEITRVRFFVDSSPVVEVLSPNGGEMWRGIRNITWDAYDGDEMNNLTFTIQYSPDNGTTWRNITSSLANETRSYLWDTSQATQEWGDGDNFLIRVIAYDGYLSGYDVSNATFSIDNTPPEISNVSASPDPVLLGGTVNITANITDAAHAVDTALLEITLPNGSVEGNFTMLYAGDGVYYYEYTTTLEGQYNFVIYANDTFSNLASVSSNFTSGGEVIDVTLSCYTLDFGSVNPGTNYSPADCFPLVVIIENTTNVETNLTIKGTDMVHNTDPSYAIAVGNITYSNQSDGAKTQLDYNYLSPPPYPDWANIPPPGSEDINRSIYLWISVPPGQPAGVYNSTITVKVEKA
jgi:uncharacterized membrane protein